MQVFWLLLSWWWVLLLWFVRGSYKSMFVLLRDWQRVPTWNGVEHGGQNSVWNSDHVIENYESLKPSITRPASLPETTQHGGGENENGTGVWFKKTRACSGAIHFLCCRTRCSCWGPGVHGGHGMGGYLLPWAHVLLMGRYGIMGTPAMGT